MRGADLSLADIRLILDDFAVSGDLAGERLKRLSSRIEHRHTTASG